MGLHHPGFIGRHMLPRAIEEVHAELDRLEHPHLSAWAAQIEQAARAHKGIS